MITKGSLDVSFEKRQVAIEAGSLAG